MKTKMKLRTNGKGLWTPEKRNVRIKKICLDVSDWGGGELRVYFNLRDWNVDSHGLIYTDPQFIRELRKELKAIGLPPMGVDYSEQGMQGWDYVSLDASEKFAKAFQKLVVGE